MTDRVRNAQDIRIVPGAQGQSTATPRASAAPASSNAGAVQQFRMLASAAGLAPSSALIAPADDALHDTPPGCASDTESAATPNAVPNLALEPQRPPNSTQAPHGDAAAHGAPMHASLGAANANAHARRQARDLAPHEQDAALGKQIVHACAVAAHADLFARELTERIARFCSMSGDANDASWGVTLPMNPAVLPDTLLHLQLSPSSIAIRFETQHPRSTQLISENTDALRTRLAESLGRQIDVQVSA